MLRIAFSSSDGTHVDLHFGGGEQLVVFDVSPGRADLIGVGEFVKAELKGENKDRGLGDSDIARAPLDPETPVFVTIGPDEDKVAAKLEFLEGCAAVYAAQIGASSIKRLMAMGAQPIIVDNGHAILDLLNEVSLAMAHGGLSWVERAMVKAEKASATAAPAMPGSAAQRLWTSFEEIE
jgi:nitrogen fixation protein NifX